MARPDRGENPQIELSSILLIVMYVRYLGDSQVRSLIATGSELETWIRTSASLASNPLLNLLRPLGQARNLSVCRLHLMDSARCSVSKASALTCKPEMCKR